MAARPRNQPKANVEQNSKLLEALKFISLAQSEEGTVNETFSMLADRMAIAFNGRLALGTPIDEDVCICPHTVSFTEALKRCGLNFVLTQLDANRIKLAAGDFEVFISCMPREALPVVRPDPNVAQASDVLKHALAAVCGLLDDNSSVIVTAAVLLRRGSAIATDRNVMLEYWHGIDLPTMIIPKASAVALYKCNKTIVGFGYDQQAGNHATFHFADGSWLRTQLYNEGYPNIDALLNKKSNPWPTPAKFFEGVEALKPFNDRIIFGANGLQTEYQERAGASFKIQGVPKGVVYSAKHLTTIKSHAKKIDFVGSEGVGFFFNDEAGIGAVRGAIVQVHKTHMDMYREHMATPEGQAELVARKLRADEAEAKWRYENPNADPDEYIPF